MTLKEYLGQLNELAKSRPELLDALVVTSKDDEGNGFNPVYYSPCAGTYEHREFENESEGSGKPNAVCLN